MPTQSNLIGSGCAPLQAQASIGIPSTGLTATGNAQANALQLGSDMCIFTTVAASTGCKLLGTAAMNIGDTIVVVNHGVSTLSVYPNTAAGKIANGSAGAAFSVSANKTAWFIYVGTDLWAASVSA